MVLQLVVLSSLLISIIAFVGVICLAVRSKVLDALLLPLVGFAAGALIGGAFLHLLPEAINKSTDLGVFLALSFGFFLFFLLEKLIWRHCHRSSCSVHPFAYINLIGDGLHNFIDGLVIAASFLNSVNLGIVTCLAVAFHEIPQEIGDFGVLVYGGLGRSKALALNFVSALTVVMGGIIGCCLSSYLGGAMVYLLPFTAGGFIYVAASDLIPELHKEADPRKTLASFTFFLLGFALMLLIKLTFTN
jgi:zinc and cadmium transporter